MLTNLHEKISAYIAERMLIVNLFNCFKLDVNINRKCYLFNDVAHFINNKSCLKQKVNIL